MKTVRFRECVVGANFVYKVCTDYQPFEYVLEDGIADHYIRTGSAVEVPTAIEAATVTPVPTKRRPRVKKSNRSK